MAVRPVLIDGDWRPATSAGSFRAVEPATGEELVDDYPVSAWADVEAALEAGAGAAKELARLPDEARARFLELFAGRLEARREELVALAALETDLPAEPRLRSVELPRTVGQLRQAAAAAREGSWALPTLDVKGGLRSMYGPLGGPVAVFGPNNFPFAFNGAAGGDFAAAVAAGNPVIAKGHPCHPGTTRLLAEEARQAVAEAGLPRATVQLLYRLGHEDGRRLVAHPTLGATGYTGSRAGGLALKEAADRAGKPIYLELSSVNPVVVLPGALEERLEEVAEEWAGSCLLGAGQFCTNPGLVLVVESPVSRAFVEAVARRFRERPDGVLLSEGVRRGLRESVRAWLGAGALLVAGGEVAAGPGFRFRNTLLTVTGARFLERPAELQAEAFGNAGLVVLARDQDELAAVVERLEGNLTGCIYSARSGADDEAYGRLEPSLRTRVGRLLNDKMPTGVAVSPAQQHGGPYPATGHPGFTSVGLPTAMLRFAALRCWDAVRPERLPPPLRDQNPTGTLWRRLDGVWTRGDVA